MDRARTAFLAPGEELRVQVELARGFGGDQLPLLPRTRTALLAPNGEVKVQVDPLKDVSRETLKVR